MPFPEPETTLPATIDQGEREITPGQQCAFCSLPGAFYDLSITYTETQRLSGGRALRCLPGWRLRVDYFWFVVRRPMNFLIHGRSLPDWQFWKANGSFRSSRFVDCLHNADIRPTLKPRGFGFIILENAVREIVQFGGKLIALGECSLCSFFADR